MFNSIRKNPKELLSRTGLIGFVLLFALAGVAALLLTRAETPTTSNSITSYPTTPPAQICGNASVLGGGPTTAPAGAVTVPAGDLVAQGINTKQSNTVYWFEPGVHTFGTGEFGQIIPGSGSTYIGAPGAIIDGQSLNRFAFTQQAENVRIAYLEIRNFVAPRDQGVVNHDSGRGWTIENNWIHHNKGAGVFLGTDNIMRNNCLVDNGQYGFQGYNNAGNPTNITVDRNEVARNNTDDWENQSPGCGCTGGVKFWLTNDVRVTNNWIHNNNSVGVWFDNNNLGSLVEGNLIEDNFGEAIFVEAGYDAQIRYNNIRRNAHGKGRKFVARGDKTFPVAAIYVSENGSPEGYNLKYAPTVISNNYLENNWNGVALWESPDRYSGSTAHTHISGTLKIGDLINDTKCKSGLPNDIPDNLDPYLCRWSTENVIVENNDFRMDKAAVGTGCLGGDVCGVNAIFSQTGSYPEFSGYTIPWRITFQQGNKFRNNTYTGDWKFAGFERSKPDGTRWAWAEWTAPAPAVPTEFTHANRPQTFGQDAGSTCDGCLTTTTDSGGTTTPSTGTVLTPNHLDADTATLEASLGKWAGWFSASATKSAEKAQVGTSSLKVDVTAPYGWGVQLNNYPGFAATAGDKTISFWGINGSGNNTVNMNVHWRKADGTVLQKDTISLGLNTAWQQVTKDVVAPVDTAIAHVDFTSNTAGAGAFMYFDEVYVGTRTGGDTTTPPADTQPPTASTLTAALARSTNADLKWTAATDNVAVTKYYVVRNGSTIAELPGTTLVYNDSYLSPSTKYDYYILAADAAGNTSPASNTATVTTPAPADTTPPTAPANLTANAASPTQVNLSWTAGTDNTGVTGYDVYRNTVKVATVTTTSYGDTGLTASTTYGYHVIARDAAGNSSPNSNTALASTPAAPVDPVANGSISGVVSSSKGGPLSGVRVKLTVNGVNYTYSTNSSGTYQAANLPPGTYSINYNTKHHTAQTHNVTVTSGNNTTKNITLQSRR